MTFEEYEAEYLSHLGPQARNLLRMGWNARGEYGSSPEKPDNSGNCQGILDSSACEVPEGLDATQEEWARINGRDHFRDATKMVQGNLILAGDITDALGMEVPKALVVQFGDDESLRAAVDSGQCRFTVFGGEV